MLVAILICVILKNVAKTGVVSIASHAPTFMSASSGMTQYFYPYFCGSKCIFMVKIQNA